MTRLLSMCAGAGVLMLVSAGAPTASAIGPATVASTAACTGDLNGDGKVLLANWGKPGATDLDGNGTTDGADQAILMGAWGPCPTEIP